MKGPAHPAWRATHAGDRLSPNGGGRRDAPPIAALGFRLTVRTYLVLSAVAELGGRGANPNNREVADAAGVSDQGQISRLLSRLEGLGLLQNTGGSTQGVPRAWQITPRGEEIVRVGRPCSERPSGRPDLPGVKR